VRIRLVTLAVVVAVATAPIGVVAAQSDAGTQPSQSADTYAVAQGDRCVTVSSFTGSQSVKELYDYRTPYPDNPYTNTTGDSFSSHGTTAIQRVNTSVLFLYEEQNDTGNDTLNLVMVHGAYDQYPSAGGAATFNITGLPADGNWAVQDDEYDNGDNYDNWSVRPNSTTVDWTWGPQRTDGGAFAGLGEEFTVTIDPAFNQNAPLYGEYYNGTLDGWEAVSNEQANSTNATYNRTELGGVEPVTISTQSCAELTNGTNETTQDDSPADDTVPQSNATNETATDDGPTSETGQDDSANETTTQDEEANDQTQDEEQTDDSTIDDEQVMPSTTTQTQTSSDGTAEQNQSVSVTQETVHAEELDEEWLDEWFDDVAPDVSVPEVEDSAADKLIERIESGEPIDEEWIDQWIEDVLGEDTAVAE
jgi:hypothetical protein